MPVERETGRMRGFGFVEIASEAEENNAIETLDGAEWMGRELRVNKAISRENNRDYFNNYRRDRNFSNSY